MAARTMTAAAGDPPVDGQATEAARATPAPGTRRARTPRGEATRRRLLDAAAAEFGERGFHDASIVSITRRAGTALGSFYTWFDSKDALFRALVGDLSDRVRDAVGPAIAAVADEASGDEGLPVEAAALRAFLGFVREHQEIYRIIDEAEFVAPDRFRAHYQGTAERIAARLAARRGDAPADAPAHEVEAWAIMGMNVFLGLRFAVWDDQADLDAVARRANRLLARGIDAADAAAADADDRADPAR